MSPPAFEHLVDTNIQEATWLRFERLSSPTLCRGIIEKRAPSLPDDVLIRKANGVASAARSAMGYWKAKAPSLNVRLLTRYYAMLQASIAEQVASADATADLSSVQRHTERGHGLAAMQSPHGDFPFNYHIFLLNSGHFASYAKHRGIDMSSFTFERRPRSWGSLSEPEKGKGLSLADLILRVPELELIASECLNQRAMSFQIGLDDSSFPSLEPWKNEKPVQSPSTNTTNAAIYVDPKTAPAEWLESLDLPFKKFRTGHDKHTSTDYWVGELSHPNSGVWWDHFEHYKSDYCGTCVIAPFWGTADVFSLHLATLYGLSIVVRYLPSLWYEVEHGRLDHIRVLIENYISVVDRIGPGLALERITGVKLLVSTPGSLSAPV